MTEYVVMIDDGDMAIDPDLIYLEAESAESACALVAAERTGAMSVLAMDAGRLPEIPLALKPCPDRAHLRLCGAVSKNWEWQICRDPEWADYIAEACVERRDGLIGLTRLAIR